MTIPERPASIDELRDKLSSPEFQESRNLEFKRQLPSNKSLAKQLAGFAAQGGALVIGVDEAATGLAVAPIDVDGARERVEQVARDIPDPPVQVESFILPSSTPVRGVLWIEIPASSAMLHQVEGTYYERGDTQTRPIGDAEVADRMRLRADRSGAIEADLKAALSRAEPGRRQWQGRTCVVARPVGASPDEFYRSTQTREVWESFANGIVQPTGGLPTIGNRYWGILERDPGQSEEIFHQEPARFQYRDIEFQETGAFCHISYCHHWLHDHTNELYPANALLASREALFLIKAVQERTGQRRMWDFACSVSNVRGRIARTRVRERIHSAWNMPKLPRDSYIRTAIGVTSQRLDSEPRAVIAKLMGRFIAECGLDFDQELPASWFPEPR